MSTIVATILAGDEFEVPTDFPSQRLDGGGVGSLFNAVGALEIEGADGAFRGSGVALSPNWVLTAGHNVDLDADGAADLGNAYGYHLPGIGEFSVGEVFVAPGFTGFAQPSVNDDLALLYISGGLPVDLFYPESILSAEAGMEITLVGYGRSGFGSFGYTSDATLTDRRIGENVIDRFEGDDDGGAFDEVFVYDFDAPGSGGSLGHFCKTHNQAPHPESVPRATPELPGNEPQSAQIFTEHSRCPPPPLR